MALEWVNKIGGTGTTLTQDEVDNNILCCYGALSRYGWTPEAIAGAIGCFHEESLVNPGVYETSHGGNLNNLPYFQGGMGLAQWTDYPAYTAQYPNPLPWSAQKEGENWSNGNFQCWLLTKADDSEYTSMDFGQGPRWGWQMSNSYPSIYFKTYIYSADYPVEQMCQFWFYDFEWHSATVPPEVSITDRMKWARYAYDLMQGKDPVVPGGGGGDMPEEYFLYAIFAKKNRRRRNNGGNTRLL